LANAAIAASRVAAWPAPTGRSGYDALIGLSEHPIGLPIKT